MVSSVLACWRLETNRKAVFTCAEEAYDILVDISDRQYLLTVGASPEGQVKEEFSQRFEVKDFSKTYEILA